MTLGFSLVHLIKWCSMSICPITDDVKVEYLSRVVSARFLHCKVTMFHCNKYVFRGATLSYINNPDGTIQQLKALPQIEVATNAASRKNNNNNISS